MSVRTPDRRSIRGSLEQHPEDEENHRNAQDEPADREVHWASDNDCGQDRRGRATDAEQRPASQCRHLLLGRLLSCQPPLPHGRPAFVDLTLLLSFLFLLPRALLTDLCRGRGSEQSRGQYLCRGRISTLNQGGNRRMVASFGVVAQGLIALLDELLEEADFDRCCEQGSAGVLRARPRSQPLSGVRQLISGLGMRNMS